MWMPGNDFVAVVIVDAQCTGSDRYADPSGTSAFAWNPNRPLTNRNGGEDGSNQIALSTEKFQSGTCALA